MKTIQKDPYMEQIVERTIKEAGDEFIRQCTERYKQTDRYKEYEKRKRAEMESEKPQE
jgi:hypothetical protein